MGGAGRFLNIEVPPSKTIEEARLILTCRSTDSSSPVNSILRGEKNINPSTFSNYADYASRVRTDALRYWDDIADWTAGEVYQSPDIKDIIQEIINLPDWASGNPIVIFWDDHDGRTPTAGSCLRRARSFDHASATPPKLYIRYAV